MSDKRPLVTRKRYLFKIYRFWKDNFDPIRGLMGLIFMGSVIFFINLHHGYGPATVAALKQGIFTFFFGGIFVKLCHNLSVRFRNKQLSITMATLIPSMFSIGLTYAVHSLRGTPEPFLSTLPAILTAPPAFFVWGWRIRTKCEKDKSLRKKMERKQRKRRRKRRR